MHELGHMHGRGHAPCGVSWWSADGDYPHSDGDIGVRAWDARSDSLLGPRDATDFMGYCDTLWASDYTYLGIMERMRRVHARQQALARGPTTRWRYLNWSDHERPNWGRVSLERDPFSGEWARVTVVDSRGRVLERRNVPYLRYAHRGERSVLVPEFDPGAHRLHITTSTTRFSIAMP